MGKDAVEELGLTFVLGVKDATFEGVVAAKGTMSVLYDSIHLSEEHSSLDRLIALELSVLNLHFGPLALGEYDAASAFGPIIPERAVFRAHLGVCLHVHECLLFLTVVFEQRVCDQ